MTGFNPNWLVGKTIARVDMRPFTDSAGRRAHDPHIHFTDGSQIWFVTEETEGEYGTCIGYAPPQKKTKRISS